ncbi:hypothetical protein [Natronosalvus rutilus]|uniref:Uncharacterized protein n=1 Tax=Natronosalvus rutilus TaxID=2953753 RepID=A0A9E7SYH2_9EURY|nr:hypothetical protein [Natronosalvus rutilus]UTF56021.1 hypothetical protein NGM29_20760 [Natronosalvus rutilus]
MRTRPQPREVRDEPNDSGCMDCGGAITIVTDVPGEADADYGIDCENCGLIHIGTGAA